MGGGSTLPCRNSQISNYRPPCRRVDASGQDVETTNSRHMYACQGGRGGWRRARESAAHSRRSLATSLDSGADGDRARRGRDPAHRHDRFQGAALERVPPTGGRLVYWVCALVTVGLAVDTLHLAWLSAGVGRLLAYLPNILAAGAIVAVGYFAGNFLYRKVTGREAASLLWARLVRGAIFAIAAFMALQELGIATAIVTVAFTVALSAMAVAAALAFGLGNRELAGRVTRDWYESRSPRSQKYEPGVHTDEEQGGPFVHPHH
jgi:hypothetical protein